MSELARPLLSEETGMPLSVSASSEPRVSARREEESTASDRWPGGYLVSTSQVNAEGIHVWPFDRAFPVDVVYHTLSGRQPFRMNRHEYIEIVHVNSGTLVWQVQNRMITHRPGDIFVMAGPIYHRITEQSSPLASVESLFFMPELLRSPAEERSECLAQFERHGAANENLVPASAGAWEEIVRLIRSIASELPAKTDRARLCVKTYIKMLLVRLMVYSGTATAKGMSANRRQGELDRFRALFQFLEKNYQNRFSPQEAAEIVSMSPSSFRRAFKQLTGQSFIEYVNHFRIAKAQELLVTTNLPITDIGLEVGFCDQSYFGMVFRRLARSTPRHYRQRALEGGTGKTCSPLTHAETRKQRHGPRGH
jgi:AraC-like DNA-binding protein/quercetin dioxygenase-like cupin family protein